MWWRRRGKGGERRRRREDYARFVKIHTLLCFVCVLLFISFSLKKYKNKNIKYIIQLIFTCFHSYYIPSTHPQRKEEATAHPHPRRAGAALTPFSFLAALMHRTRTRQCGSGLLLRLRRRQWLRRRLISSVPSTLSRGRRRQQVPLRSSSIPATLSRGAVSHSRHLVDPRESAASSRDHRLLFSSLPTSRLRAGVSPRLFHTTRVIQQRSPYEVLGVSPGASKKEIKDA